MKTGNAGLFFVFVWVLFTASCVSIEIRDAVKSSDRARGVYHRIKPGETLWRISKAYHVDLQELAELNNITDQSRIVAGNVIFIPDAAEVIDLPPVKTAARTPEPGAVAKVEPPRIPEASPPAAVPAAPSTIREEGIVDRPAQAKASRTPDPLRPPETSRTETAHTSGPLEEAPSSPARPPAAPVPARPPEPRERVEAPRKPEPPPRAEEGQIKTDKGRFSWPVRGNVITRFGIQSSGMKYNGIRIAAREGTPVQAAAAGTVIYSSYVRGYGETVLVKHDDHFTTVYAYLKDSVAKKDRKVKRGERIASVGPAEESGGEPNLYFEVREKNKARNPLFFLP